MVLVKFVIFLCILGQIYCQPNYNPGLPYQPAGVNYPHPVPNPVIYNNVRQNIHPVVPRQNIHPPIPQYNPPPIYRPNYPPLMQQTYAPVQHLPSLPQPPPPHFIHHRIHQTTCVAHPKYQTNQDPQVYPEVTPKCYQTNNVRICTKQSSSVAVSTPAPQTYETPPPQPTTTPPTNYNTNVAPSYPATSNNDRKPILKIVNTNTYTIGKQTPQVYTTSTSPPPLVVCKTTSTTTTPYPQVPTIPDNTYSTPSLYPSVPSYAPDPYSEKDKMKQKEYKSCRNPYCYNCPYDPYNMPYYDDYPQYPPPYYYNSNEPDVSEYMKTKSVCLDKKKPKDISCSDITNKLKSVTIVDAPEKEKKFVYEKPIPVTYPPIPTYNPSFQTKPPYIYNNGPYYPEVQPKYPCDTQTVNYVPMKLLKKQDESHSYPSKIKKMKNVKSVPKKCPKMKLKKKDSSSSSSSSSSKSSSSCQRVKYGYGKIDTHSVRAELSKRHILGHPVINPYTFKPFDDIKQNNKVYKSETDSSMTSDSKRDAEIKHKENVSRKVNSNKFQKEMDSKDNQRASQS